MLQLETAHTYLQLKRTVFNDLKEFCLEVDRQVLAKETTGLIIPGEFSATRFKITWEVADPFLVDTLRADPEEYNLYEDDEDEDEGLEEGIPDDDEEELDTLAVSRDELEEEEEDEDEDEDEDQETVSYRLGLRLWNPDREDKTLATVFVEVAVDDYWIAWIQGRKVEGALGWHPIIQEDKNWSGGTSLTIRNFDLEGEVTPQEVAEVVLEAAKALREFWLND